MAKPAGLAVCLPGLLLAGLSHGVAADVQYAGPDGFLSTHTLRIAAPPKTVYRALTREVARWWDPVHSYSGEARNFRMTAQAGGCLCERLPAGGSVEHMHVVFAQPAKELRLSGGLGPLQTMAVSGAMTFRFSGAAKETSTVLEYSYLVSGTSTSALDTLAEPVDAVQLGQLTRLKHWVERRNANWPALNRP